MPQTTSKSSRSQASTPDPFAAVPEALWQTVTDEIIAQGFGIDLALVQKKRAELGHNPVQRVADSLQPQAESGVQIRVTRPILLPGVGRSRGGNGKRATWIPIHPTTWKGATAQRIISHAVDRDTLQPIKIAKKGTGGAGCHAIMLT